MKNYPFRDLFTIIQGKLITSPQSDNTTDVDPKGLCRVYDYIGIKYQSLGMFN
jgi:hypothetical protein